MTSLPTLLSLWFKTGVPQKFRNLLHSLVVYVEFVGGRPYDEAGVINFAASSQISLKPT